MSGLPRPRRPLADRVRCGCGATEARDAATGLGWNRLRFTEEPLCPDCTLDYHHREVTA